MNRKKGMVCCCFLFLTVMLGMKIENYLVDTQPIIKNVPTTRKVVALTFDDGPLDKTTPEILGILREKNIRATFFVLGEQVVRFPMLVQQEIMEGHEVGSHGYDHMNLTRLTAAQVKEQLENTENLISLFAPAPTLFRPPGGNYNDTVLKLARDRGYLVILWSIDTSDWRLHSVGKIVSLASKNIKPGSIILLHDGIYPSATPEALEFIIDNLSK